MMENSNIPVGKDIVIIIKCADDAKEILHTARIEIDEAKILKIVQKDGIFKAETSLPTTSIEGTKFSFDEEHVYYDNKVCRFSSSENIIAVALFKEYYNGGSPLTAGKLLSLLGDSGYHITEGTLRKNLTDMRHIFCARVGIEPEEHNFIRPEPHKEGYRFNPILAS